MREPVFLSVALVVRLHQKSILRFGGAAGVRDQGLLESAIAQPQHTYYYGNGDLYDIAAAYAYHIAQAQACFDGNKRTGVASALLFLELNGVSTDFDSMPLYEAMIAVAERRMDKTRLAGLLRELFPPK
ncbi:MAG TPA: type II toxin-antitoxin system death-on-curing family toxin [Candidatus Methylacidiphilales bacterium]